MVVTITSTRKEEREALFLELYQQCFLPIASYIRKMGGTIEEAQDIFHESLIVYYETILAQQVKIQTNEESYLFGIAKNLWKKRFREIQKTQSLAESLINIPAYHHAQPVQQKLTQWLEAAGKKCLNLLQSFYYNKNSMEQVAEELGFASPHSATVQKYKCIEKIREEMKAKKVCYEDFFE